jgi:hypothetical protein
MKRFICEQNVVHFEKLLAETSDPTLRRTLNGLLATAKRELALLDADQRATDQSPSGHRRGQASDASVIREFFLSDFDKSPHPYMLIDPGPGLRIIDVNAAYAAVTFTRRDVITGKSLFEVFPDNPDDALADGVSNLYALLSTVARTGRPHAMAIQRYDVRDSGGIFVERHWQPINTPAAMPPDVRSRHRSSLAEDAIYSGASLLCVKVGRSRCTRVRGVPSGTARSVPLRLQSPDS